MPQIHEVKMNFACGECALSKSIQKKVNKISKNETEIPGQRIFVDISYVMNESYGKKILGARGR